MKLVLPRVLSSKGKEASQTSIDCPSDYGGLILLFGPGRAKDVDPQQYTT